MKSFPWFSSYPEGVPHEIKTDEYPSVVEMIEETCRKYADKVAYENMGAQLTFAEVDRLSRNFAAYLQKDLGLKKGERIAIQMPNCLQFPIAFFGALRAGLIVVNTNPLYTSREMEHQFKDSGASAIVIVANFASNLEKIIGNTQIRHVIITELGDMLGGLKRPLVNFVVRNIKKMVPRTAALSLTSAPKSVTYFPVSTRVPQASPLLLSRTMLAKNSSWICYWQAGCCSGIAPARFRCTSKQRRRSFQTPRWKMSSARLTRYINTAK